MTTCQTLNGPKISALLPLARNVVSTSPGARTWLAPGDKTSADKVENTLNTVLELIIDNHKIENRRNS